MINKKLIYEDILLNIHISETEPFPADGELTAIINSCKEQYHLPMDKMDLNFDGEYVDVKCYFKPVPFERIRRITGYLVGNINNFNDAKSAELKDRKKHSLVEKMRIRDTDGDGRADYIDSDGYSKPSMKYKKVTAEEFEKLSSLNRDFVKAYSVTEDGDFIIRLNEKQKNEVDVILKPSLPTNILK